MTSKKLIEAKLATKKVELEGCSQIGPMVLFVIGVITVLFLVGILIIIVAAVWSSSVDKEANKIKSEIKELELELIEGT